MLDVGCIKAFFMHDLKEALPGIRIKGVENHSYPLEFAVESVKGNIVFPPYEKLLFKDNEFHFVFAIVSIYMLSFWGVLNALREIQ